MDSEEVARLQGFPADWGSAAGLSGLDRIRGFGDAVPPRLSEVLFSTLGEFLGTDIERTVEICAGFGGLAQGLRQGLRPREEILIERWAPACRILEASGLWPAESILEMDARDVAWEKYRDTVDVLSGGPPCQPWSAAGQQLGEADDRDLLGLTPDIVAQVRPKAFVFENVPGLLRGKNRGYAEWLVRRLRNPGRGLEYAVSAAVFNSADFGVAQTRRRVFIVGIRSAPITEIFRFFDAVWKKRRFADPRKAMPKGFEPWRTVSDALPDWAEHPIGWRRWIDAKDSQSASLDEHALPESIIPQE